MVVFSDDLDTIRLDENKLSAEERERLRYIKSLTEEADQFVRDAGQVGDDEDEDRDISSVEDTNWSGQSDLDSVTPSNSNWASSSKRDFYTDVLALLALPP